MDDKEIGKRYVELAKQHKNEEILTELFAPDCESVEAGAPPGQERGVKGLEAIRGKSKWWADNHEVHSAKVEGPYPHDDRFAVKFTYEVTFKPAQKRFVMDEIGLFTIKDGRIAKEEFFYGTE